MDSRSYNSGTATKRSTGGASKTIPFPREEDGSPRIRIIMKECPDEYSTFKQCVKENDGKEAPCIDLKEKMNECGVEGFRKANKDPDYEY